MTLDGAALLGVLQALTEFLPVSSSGHLRLAHDFFGFESGDDLLFDILVHAGTLVAVCAVYNARIRALVADLFRGIPALVDPRAALARHEGLRYAALVILATIPTGVIGILMSGVLDSDAIGSRVVGGLLLLNGVILWVSRGADRRDPDVERPYSIGGIGPREALLIGIAQGIAVLPGISRSGITIVTALWLGAERMRAAEFSFLLSIPAILGAVVLEFDPAAMQAEGAAIPYAVGAITAAVVGIFALIVLLRIVRRARLHRFAWYCWAMGAAAIILAS